MGSPGLMPAPPETVDPAHHAAARWLDRASETEAVEALGRCCGSRRWVRRMEAARPFEDGERLLAESARIWEGLAPEDWLEAFAAHPRIGERNVASAWSRREQSGVASAAEGERSELAAGNRAYEERFGHVFLICATGRSTSGILGELRRRLELEPEDELRNAAAEQARITALRLARLGEEAAQESTSEEP